MTRAMRNFRKKILRWHKIIGLVVGIPLLLSVVTGLLLQYPQLFNSYPKSETSCAIAIDPLQLNHWLKGTNFGLYHSFDHGVSWHESPLMWSPGSIRTLVFSPDNLQMVYALGSDGLLVSHDSGRVWEVVQLTLPDEFGWGEFLDLSLGQGGILGLLTKSGLAVSNDGGLSWVVQHQTSLESGANVLGFIHGLHTGHWIGTTGSWSVTITGIGTLLLVCSGFILASLRRKKGNQRCE